MPHEDPEVRQRDAVTYHNTLEYAKRWEDTRRETRDTRVGQRGLGGDCTPAERYARQWAEPEHATRDDILAVDLLLQIDMR
jgi:hypothetical protein